jgi:hypothetical protein
MALVTAPAAARSQAPPPLGRAVEQEIELVDGDVSVRFSFPVRVPLWFLWQNATDCRAYLRNIPEVKKCQHLSENGKPVVILEGELLGRPYRMVVGLSRRFGREGGRLDFETKNVAPRPAKGALRIEREEGGQSRVRFEARVPKDPDVPELLVRLGVASAIHSMAHKVQSELEADWRASRGVRVPEDLGLHKVVPKKP